MQLVCIKSMSQYSFTKPTKYIDVVLVPKLEFCKLKLELKLVHTTSNCARLIFAPIPKHRNLFPNTETLPKYFFHEKQTLYSLASIRNNHIYNMMRLFAKLNKSRHEPHKNWNNIDPINPRKNQNHIMYLNCDILKLILINAK